MTDLVPKVEDSTADFPITSFIWDKEREILTLRFIPQVVPRVIFVSGTTRKIGFQIVGTNWKRYFVFRPLYPKCHTVEISRISIWLGPYYVEGHMGKGNR